MPREALFRGLSHPGGAAHVWSVVGGVPAQLCLADRHGGGGEEEGRAGAGVVANAGRLPPPRLRLVRLLRHLGAPRRRFLPDGE